jgi:hypothetical protein
MKTIRVLFSFLFASSLWSATPVPYSGKIDIGGVNYYGEAQFRIFLCMMGTVQLIGEMVINQEKLLR